MFTSAAAGRRRAKPIPSWAGLLERLHERTGLSLPALRELKADEIPQPCRALLVHSSDMTSTLERFYGQTLRLRVLSRERQQNTYKREVILWLAEDEREVEYGVIQIYLDRLPPAARRLVLQEERPLGDILNGEAIPFLSWPQAFFRIKVDARSGVALGVRRPGFVYGRRNVLLDGSRHLLAEVIEVLASVDKSETAPGWAKPGIPAAHTNGTHLDTNQRLSPRTPMTQIRN